MSPRSVTSHLHLLTAFFAFLAPSLLPARDTEIKGKCVGVPDGDTITVLTGKKKEVKVRLEGIDAPELGQSYGKNSKQNLSNLVFGKEVRVVISATDDYGRKIGNVYVGDVWANLAQVEAGMAWQYTHYNHDPKLKKAEVHARAEHLGLWHEKSPTPPWDYRHHSTKKK